MTALPRVGEYQGPDIFVHPESEPFWRGLGAGQLLLQKCVLCNLVRFPIAPLCWRCGATKQVWVPIATEGRVSAAVTVHRATGNQKWASEVPFVTALVDMADGLRLPGRVIGDLSDAPHHGYPVRAGYLEAPRGYGVLCFVPMAQAGLGGQPEFTADQGEQRGQPQVSGVAMRGGSSLGQFAESGDHLRSPGTASLRSWSTFGRKNHDVRI